MKSTMTGPQNRRRKIARLRGMHALQAVCEPLESRRLLASVPTTSLVVPQDPLIGETATFEVGFQNSSPTDVGYGPYIDLILPATGADGDDGITFESATYLGMTLNATVLTFDANGNAVHPLAKDASGAPLIIQGNPGDQLVVMALPFGSFTPGQPEAVVEVTTKVSPLADVGTSLPVQVQGGFYLGDTPVDDPATDPSVVGPTVTGTTTPQVVRIKKTYLGPEQETATGPNFPRQYRITVDVADGQTVTNLDLSDLLPSNMQFIRVVDTLVHGASTATTAISTPSLTTPGGSLVRRFASVTGDASDDDAELLFSFYIPQFDAGNSPVLTPGSGQPTTSVDQANSQANWDPLDPRDPLQVVTSNTATDTITDRSIAVQKTVRDVIHTGPANAVSPGDTLEYSIQIQISDFFAFQNFVVNDLLSDGQTLDPSFQPTFLYHGNGIEVPNAAFDGPNVVVVPQSNGSTSLAFLVSNELIERGFSGRLFGGMVSPTGGMLPAPGDGPTTATITFRTIINKTFTATPSPGAVVGQGDKLGNSVTVSGDVLDNNTLAPTGSTVVDDSHAETVISAGSLSKTVYMINGSAPVGPVPNVKPGDDVTYRLQYTLPNSNFNSLTLTDFLPLPIFDATTVTAFQAVVSAAAPGAGLAKFGPSDTFFALSGLVPVISVDAVANSVRFSWPTYINANNANTVIDLLFTVRVSAEPFADQLLLVNEAQSNETTTNNTPVVSDEIAQIILNEPALNIRKGVVATDDPLAQFTAPVGPVPFNPPGSTSPAFTAPITSAGLAGTPIDSNLVQAQGSDFVTFAITIENTGTGPNGAFDVTFADTLPAGFQIPAGGLNLHVTDGTGVPLAFIDLGGGLFGSGLRLVDPSATSGALARYSPTSGKNIAIITYDLELSPSVPINTTLVNTASLSHYASVPNGPDFLPAEDLTDPASVGVKGISVTKALTATDQAFTTGASELAIGEIGTYTVTITVPQGVTPGARLVDALPDGLAIVDLVSLTTSSPEFLTFSNGTLASILATAQASGIGANGSSATFDFGDILDSDTDPTRANTITAVYRVVALNVAANTNNRSQTNTARLFYSNTSTTASTTAKILVPRMQVAKAVDNPTADAGDVVTYTITINHASNSGTDAFNVELGDLIPAGVAYVPGSLTYVPSGALSVAPTTLAYDAVGNRITASYDSFARTQVSVLTFQAVVDSDIQAFQRVTNTARIEYTTLPGSPQASSPYNPNSVERTGDPTDPGGSANNLNASASATFAPTPTITKVLVGTNQTFTTGNAVAIGETAQYRVTIVVPEGVSPAAVFADQLPDGLALVSIDQLIASPSLTTSLGSFANIISNAVVENGGRLFTLNLGDVTNPVVNGAPQTITIEYTTVVLNVASNQSGTTLTNDATFQAGTSLVEISADPLNVVTPRLNITKTASPTQADSAGAPVTFTVVISHDPTSTIDAFDLTVIDPLLLLFFDFVPGSLVNTAGQAPTSLQFDGLAVVATYDRLAVGATSTIQFQATLSQFTAPGQTLENLVGVFYTTLPGDAVTPASPYNPVSTERTGHPSDPGGSANDLAASDEAEVDVFSNSLSGTVFADLNNDGLFNGSDTLLSGVEITLTGTNNLGDAVNLITTTDANGFYSFTNLRPGSYVITETQPSGYLSGINTIGTQGGNAAPPTSDVLSNIVLPVGVSTDGTGNNFAELLPSSLAGAVYVDANENGLQESGEVGIAGVTITLTGTDDLGAVSQTTTTAADGTYSFPDLRPGNYVITETQPDGFVTTINAIGTQGGTVGADDDLTVVELGQDVTGTGNNFGERFSSSLSGVVFVDLNNDGLFNGSDTLLPGVTLTLTGTDNLGNAVSQTTTTDANGAYAFTELRSGEYVITETQPTGYLSGINTIGTQGGTASEPPENVLSSIVLPVGVSTDGVGNNFAELLPSSLAGTVYVDANENGLQESGEAGIPGVTITLTGTDDLGAVSQTTTTGADGTYSFPDLRPGSYVITETQPDGFVTTINAIGTQGGTVGTDDDLTEIELVQDVDGTGNNFGERYSSTLSGVVFHDLNNDGIQNASGAPLVVGPAALVLPELGIPGVTITLVGVDNLGNPVLLTTTTAADGTYSFPNLRAGTYLIRETQPTGYLSGINTIGTQGGTAAAPPADVLSNIVLPVGASTAGTGNNFAELLPSSLSGTVYVDANENGIQEEDEVGIPGVTITLTGTDDLGLVSLTTTTDATGAYSFPNLRPGSYVITETQPDGFVTTINAIGTQGGAVGADDVLSAILIGQDVNGIVNNFGERYSSSLSGMVFVDVDNDGVFNGGDTPIAGVIITLTGTDNLGNAVNLTTTTGANGRYVFTELRSGAYVITEAQPSGFVSGINTIGSQGGVAAPTPEDVLFSIVLPVGVSTAGVANNFAELFASSLAGTVFVDLDQNGIQGPGESGIPGVTITLTGTDDLGRSVLLVTTTGADGSYRFDDLRSGAYTITETQPQAYLTGINTIGTQGGFAAPPPADVLSNIVLPAGVATHGIANNFAEINPTSLSGCVYWDVNHNGVMDSADYGIAGVTITLTGTDDFGNAIQMVTTTADDGTYQFTALRPGTYTITETQPPQFRDFKDNMGSLGGIHTNDRFSSIVVRPGDQGVNYCFGELQKPGCSLRHIAVAVGDRVALDLARRARNPAAFDARFPRVGASLAQGQVPRGVAGYPRGPLAYASVPLLGTKRLVRFVNPETGRVDLRGTPNFTAPLTARQQLRQANRFRLGGMLKGAK